jgi:DNA-binding MarR family transcriptional regulator
VEAIEQLFDEVRLLWHALVQSGEQLHEKEHVTLGMRAVLEFLALNGPSTVPHIARSRNVTRQHIQTLVNALVEQDLAALGTNPAHRRSALVRLTPEGEKVIERMRRREHRFFEQTDFGSRADDLRRATQTLRAVRNALGGRT